MNLPRNETGPVMPGANEARERNRREMPNVADIVDQMTEFFGPVKVLYAEDFETRKSAGKRPDGS